MDIVDFLVTRFQEDISEARKLLASSDVSLSDRWYEERLLKECETKLMLIEIIGGTRRHALSRMVVDPDEDPQFREELEWTRLALSALAAVHEDHPDFQDNWRLTQEHP
ncbi:DUF6221 family protein [Arthrobacter zhaoxinii]|uniref:DUF6221 family protein n=1 Tax=Arthrobacter zhaoxinii TaxID=2964616 RepID=A0ABY5YT03_9MICC|nr:DUF6221 family protein [Arthrobacter zhaoxinii]UWX96810.1 DUF6221 family protein [Arthrobacter zhaoxinii]